MTRGASIVAVLALVSAATGCGSNEPKGREKKKAPDQADSVRRLQEGPDSSFGLKLPIGSTIVRNGPAAMDVQVPAPMDEVMTYLRARLDAKSVDVGPRSTVFRFAKVVDGPPGRVDVTVIRLPSLTKLNIAVHPDPSLEPSSSPGSRPRPALPAYTSQPVPPEDDD